MMIESNAATKSERATRPGRQSLKGKVAFITGGTGTLGGEVAKEFGRRGARLLIQYNSHVRKAIELELALKMTGVEVTMVQADYTRSLDLRDLVRTVSAHTERLDFLVHIAGICTRSHPSVPEPVVDMALMNRINQIAPIEITLGLEEKILPGTVILYLGSAVEDIRWEGASVYGESKKGLHHFAAQYADAAARRGASSIYYLPGVLDTAGKEDPFGARRQEAMLRLGQTDPLTPSRLARNIVSSVMDEPLFGVGDSNEGHMRVRRDGYRM